MAMIVHLASDNQPRTRGERGDPMVMLDVTEVYRPDADDFDLRPFEDRVLELVGLFHDTPAVRLRVLGRIAAGEPIEALPDPGEPLDLISPERAARRHPALHLLRGYLCPALDRVSGDAFEIARVITPLLAGLKLAGTAPIDLDPWLFAGLALLIARGGVAAFCGEGEVDDEGTGNVAESAAAEAGVPHSTVVPEVAHEGRRHAPEGHDQGRRHGRKRLKR